VTKEKKLYKIFTRSGVKVIDEALATLLVEPEVDFLKKIGCVYFEGAFTLALSPAKTLRL
jgi:hypothetical protein